LQPHFKLFACDVLVSHNNQTSGNNSNHSVAPYSKMESLKMTVYTTEQLAEKLGVSRQYARELCSSGRIASVDLSRGKQRATYRVTEQALEEFLNPGIAAATKKTQRRSRIDRDVRQVY
jgi:excisionase family DNA binding protein